MNLFGKKAFALSILILSAAFAPVAQAAISWQSFKDQVGNAATYVANKASSAKTYTVTSRPGVFIGNHKKAAGITVGVAAAIALGAVAYRYYKNHHAQPVVG